MAYEREDVRVDVALTLRNSGDDWWVIERAEHSGEIGFVRAGPNSMSLWCASRISDADIEGNGCEMRELALAIKARGASGFRRCAVHPREDGSYALWSPRNSLRVAVVPLARADALADEILSKLPVPDREGSDGR